MAENEERYDKEAIRARVAMPLLCEQLGISLRQSGWEAVITGGAEAGLISLFRMSGYNVTQVPPQRCTSN